MAEFMYGIRQSDGKTISIYDIPDDHAGLKCNCKCPSCQIDFEACSLHGKVNRYFRHYSDKAGGGGAGNGCDVISANESALHLMAKEIIEEELKVFVPLREISLKEAGITCLPDKIKAKITRYVHQPSEVVECQSVELEKSLPGFKPDVVVHTARGEILIEVVVTNDINREKKLKLKEYGKATLKIDLSAFVEKPISREELRKIIVDKADLKAWAYYPLSPEDIKTAKQYYENIVAVKQYLKEHEAELKKARVDAEKRERREKKLSALLQPQNYNAELVRLRSDEKFIAYAQKEFVFYKDHKTKPFFIDIPITGEMVFQCDRRIWQGIIFDRFIYKRKQDEAAFNVSDIFNKLKTDHKLPIDYDLTYKITLENEEEYWLRVDVIKKYIRYLEVLGFIAWKHTTWQTVKARRTIIPPNKEYAERLLTALKNADRRSPDIDRVLSDVLNDYYVDRERKAREERNEAIRVQQEAREEQRRKNREAAMALAAQRREEHRLKIQNFDYDQSEERIEDEAGWRLAKCTVCNSICRAAYVKLDLPNLNKGICKRCQIKQRRQAVKK